MTTTIVVEGIGDIVSRPTGYGRALQKLKIDLGGDLRVIFADVCEEWSKLSGRDLAERKGTRDSLTKWGAEFIDKPRSNRAQRRLYQGLLNRRADALFVAN